MPNNVLTERRAGIDVALTNLSIGIPTDQSYIGDRLLPTLTVGLSSVKIPSWGNEAFRIREDRVADHSEPDKLDVSVDTTTVEVEGHSFMASVSRREQMESMRGPLQVDLDFEVLQTIKAVMALSREKLQADLLTATAAYTSDFKIDLNATSAQWDDPAVDPLDNLIPMIETTMVGATGVRPNTLWMSQSVWAKLMVHPLVRSRIMGTTGPQPLPTMLQFGSLVGIERILVGAAVSKTPGGVNTAIWGKNAGLIYVPPTSGRRVPASGYTVEQTVFGSATEKIFRWPDEKIGPSGGDWVKRSTYYTPVKLFAGSSSLFYNVIA